MMSHHTAEAPSGGNRDGALAKGTERAPFNVKNTKTLQKIKGFMIESLLLLAAIPVVLLLLPFVFLMAVGSLFVGRAAS